MKIEEKILLAAVGARYDANRESELGTLLHGPVDWSLLGKISAQHGVSHLLFSALELYKDLADPGFLKNLGEKIFLQSTTALHYIGVLFELHDILEKDGIVVVPFKGPSLSQLLYGNPGVRAYSDLDILISCEDVERAVKLLQSGGYLTEIDISDELLANYMLHEDNLTLLHPDAGVCVELHWELSGRTLQKPLTLQSLSGRLEPLLLTGRQIESLATEDLLLYLCVHGTKHVWSRLDWLCCVAALIRVKPDVDWTIVLQSAQERKCLRMVLLGLSLAADLLAVDLPDQVCTMISSDKALVGLAEDVKKVMFPSDGTMVRDEEQKRFMLFHLRVRDTWWQASRYGLRLLFRPTIKDWLHFPFSSHRGVALYVYRPIRLGLHFIRKNLKKDVKQSIVS